MDLTLFVVTLPLLADVMRGTFLCRITLIGLARKHSLSVYHDTVSAEDSPLEIYVTSSAALSLPLTLFNCWLSII
jgi:hypothetical protein